MKLIFIYKKKINNNNIIELHYILKHYNYLKNAQNHLKCALKRGPMNVQNTKIGPKGQFFKKRLYNAFMNFKNR
jgi:hypothetical protein